MAACLAVFIGQSGAFAQTTNSVWDLTAITELSAGKIKDTSTNSANAVFLSDGTFALVHGTNQYDGTYTNTTKSLTVTFSPSALAALESNVVILISSEVPGVTVTIKSSKFSKIKLLDGVPVKVSDKISGKGSETIDGKTRSKSFKFTTLYTEWTLSSGTVF